MSDSIFLMNGTVKLMNCLHLTLECVSYWFKKIKKTKCKTNDWKYQSKKKSVRTLKQNVRPLKKALDS